MNSRYIPSFIISAACAASTLMIGATALLFSTSVNASANVAAHSCPLNKQRLSADYTLTRTWDIGRSQTKQLTLWRNANEVALQYPQQAITEIWTRGKDGRSRPVRYFDDYQRGIEYFPNEVKGSATAQVWQSKYQLIDDDFRQQMTLVSEAGQGCLRTETYELKQQGKRYRLVWQPASQLVIQYQEQAMSQLFTIELQQTSQDSGQIDQFFASRQAYQTTDYADVGDNESDPFFLKMMSLGFVQHGASGFYNADGSKLGGNSHVH
ncbi:hypothetical protein IC617_07795 [Neiella sp. HB171785]|uniref:DUF3108 domain-containing protein n=1 Tax=Neiella litorisoli TaxID=2771431 RepID=A0A8J6UE77_9GAMM|nr:hypothetical protein [Neiella litorisoli]MBD1389324.1 hypothetical protein [Neiella litorisoli]